MSSQSSRYSSSKKVSISYTDSPRHSYDSLASRSSSEYSPRQSYDMATTASTQGSYSSRYDGYSGSAFSRTSNSSRNSDSGASVDRLVRAPNATKATTHGYYAKDRTHSSGKKVTVHNHEMRSERDEPRTSSYKR